MSNYTKAKNKLDRWFSQFIRLRDTDVNGYGSCISCGKIVFWKKAHAGHFIGRNNLALRWNEKNVNLQCVKDNTYGEGEQYRYSRGLEIKYGAGTCEMLEIMKKNKAKYTHFELNILADQYKEKVKELLKQKNL